MPRSWTAPRWRRAPSARCGASAIRSARRAPCMDEGRLRAAGRRRPPMTSRERAGLAMVENSYFTTQRRVDALRQPEGQRARPGTILHGVGGREARHRRRRRAATAHGQSRGRHLDRRLQQQAGRAGRRQRRSSAPAPMRSDGVCAVSCTGQGEIFIRRVRRLRRRGAHGLRAARRSRRRRTRWSSRR